MQRNKLTSERYPNTTLYLAKECLGFLSKHTEVDISIKNGPLGLSETARTGETNMKFISNL